MLQHNNENTHIRTSGDFSHLFYVNLSLSSTQSEQCSVGSAPRFASSQHFVSVSPGVTENLFVSSLNRYVDRITILWF